MSPRFDNSLARLGEPYVWETLPTSVSQPRWLAWNQKLAKAIDWPRTWCHNAVSLQALAGNSLLPGSEPVATVYAGHQFGQFNPQLGDGRAVLIGEWCCGDEQRFDIQLKGAGPTRFSRGGDGRSPTGPVVREYLVSEAMHSLGVPTTRALAAVATGDSVWRNHAEPGAVLTRVARSHLRIGTIEYFASTHHGDGLPELVNYCIERHFPDQSPSSNNSAAHLLSEVTRHLAITVAHWQSIGFVHGVLNTDNILLCADTIDYGPCAFIDTYDPNACFSSIDRHGRYQASNQPGVAHWNLSVLAGCLLNILHTNKSRAQEIAQTILSRFPDDYAINYRLRFARKIGLKTYKPSDDDMLSALLNLLARNQHDFTLAFRWLTEIQRESGDTTPIQELFVPSKDLRDWVINWRRRLSDDPWDSSERTETMERSNPVVIPRNHLVAAAINLAERNETSLLATLNQRWQDPFNWECNDLKWAAAPKEAELVRKTYCGT